MDINTRSHKAQLLEGFLENEDNRRMDWPAKFPDIISIYHVKEKNQEKNCLLPFLSENHPGACCSSKVHWHLDSSIASCVVCVTLCNLSSCERGLYPTLA
ncbi:hypothetical protein TNCV_1375411 [Trichonephila clavipes]|nr:hypothetical protein TNCV_1375411 [Trichonephila clavipes]